MRRGRADQAPEQLPTDEIFAEHSYICASWVTFGTYVITQKSTPTQLEFEENRKQHSGRKPSIHAGWRTFAEPTG